MDGTCSVTQGGKVDTFSYEHGRLTHTASTPWDYRTAYTYEGSRLTHIVRTIGGVFAFRKELRYDANDRLEEIVTVSPGREIMPPGETERVDLEYDTAGHVVRTTRSRLDLVDGTRVCVFGYDDQGRFASYACEQPRSEDLVSNRTTYHYDAAGRLSEVRTVFRVLHDQLRWEYHYDAAGRLASAVAILDSGDVYSSLAIVRDATGRERERRSVTRGGEDVVEAIAFDGTFGADVECGVIRSPPGVPEEHGLIGLLEMAL